MRFFLDENLTVRVIPPLVAVFGGRHEFLSADDLGVRGVDDVDLYPRVRAEGALAIISKDDRQLRNEVERRGLFDHRLSFVHLRTSTLSGMKGLALVVAALISGLPYVEERWESEPHVFRLKGLQSGFTERISSHLPIWQDRWGDRPPGTA